MGLTIHYGQGKAESRAKIEELFRLLEEIAKARKMEYWFTELKEPNAEPSRLGKPTGNKGVNQKTLHINPDQGSETFSIGFELDRLDFEDNVKWDRTGEISNMGFFCKTQYSQNFALTHDFICRTLDFIKRNYVKDMEVYDEGDYYDKWDLQALGVTIAKWDEMIKSVGGKLKDMFGGNENITIEQADIPERK